MVPKDWQRSTLGKIARISSGGTPDRSNAEYWQGDVPWVTTGEVQFNTIISTQEKITEAGLKNSSAKIFPINTLLMAMYGQGKTRGQVAKLGIVAATNQACAAILLRDEYDTDFYFQYLSYQYQALRELGNAGTQKNLSAGIIKQVPVPVPPINEQRYIAKILSTWDKAIQFNEKLLKNTANKKLWIMQKLLTGKHRIKFDDSVWTEYLLEELFSERVEIGRSDLPLLSITRENGVIPREDVGRKDTSNDDKAKYQRIFYGDIGYNTMRMWQGVSALSQYEGIISPAYTVLVPKGKINAKYASYLFKYKPIVFLFYRYSQGLVSDTWNLKYSQFSKIKIKIPKINEQKEIVEILESVDEQLAIINLIVKRLKEEKSVLMEQLLTGKRRVNSFEAEMENLV